MFGDTSSRRKTYQCFKNSSFVLYSMAITKDENELIQQFNKYIPFCLMLHKKSQP